MNISDLNWAMSCCGDAGERAEVVLPGGGALRLKRSLDRQTYYAIRYSAHGACLDKDADGAPVYVERSKEYIEAL